MAGTRASKAKTFFSSIKGFKTTPTAATKVKPGNKDTPQPRTRESRRPGNNKENKDLHNAFEALSIEPEEPIKAVKQAETHEAEAKKDEHIADPNDWTTVRGRATSRAHGQAREAINGIVAAAVVNEPWKEDWRNPDPKANALRYAAAATAHTTQTKGTRYTCKPGPRTKSGTLLVDQVKGNIVFRWDIRPYPSTKLADNHPQIIWVDGVRSRKKGRYFLIVKSTFKFVWEAPIYMKNNTGLTNVDPMEWKEYFSLKPFDISPEAFKSMNQVSGSKYFSVTWMHNDDPNMRGNKMRATSVVHFTEIKKRRIDVDDMRLVGAIAKDEVEELCAKAHKHIKD
ncbi:hypothetical protein LTR15_004507 [Elasticomyces elasticus]|nr:hypothetical protein LTR15_004507 [Elasticomyces elasticus]